MNLRAAAPGKVNLCLFLGGTRADGRHELLTVLQSLSLADTLTLTLSGAEADAVICDRVSGPNLVGDVIVALRERGWEGPPLAFEIDKRIPVAAGMAGGSADAAAALRLAAAVAPVAPHVMLEIAAALGSDIPSQLSPGVALATGAGELVEPLAALPEHAYVVIPSEFQLSTADVYREADRLGPGRSVAQLQQLQQQLRAALSSAGGSQSASLGPAAQASAPLPPELIVNDLQPAALSLCPQIQEALDAAEFAGADRALVSGSGPTVAGIWWGQDAATRAASAQQSLVNRFPRATVALPAGPRAGAVEAL
jgi:4-diphosphocytidyl-2-C-methyl-D-erythritol kinase